MHLQVATSSPRTYRIGALYEGVRAYLGAMIDEFDDLRNTPEEFIDAGEQVVVTTRAGGRGKQSGAPVELTTASVCLLKDARIIRNYREKAEAFEAAGLRE